MTWVDAFTLRGLMNLLADPTAPAEPRLNMIDEVTFQKFKRMGFKYPRKLRSGQWAGLRSVVHYVVLYVGLNEEGLWTASFAFDGWESAQKAIETWDGTGFPPGYSVRDW